MLSNKRNDILKVKVLILKSKHHCNMFNIPQIDLSALILLLSRFENFGKSIDQPF